MALPEKAQADLDRLRDTAVGSLRHAIHLAPDNPMFDAQFTIALKFAVRDQAQYTLACRICPVCEHLDVEHTEDSSCRHCRRIAKRRKELNE